MKKILILIVLAFASCTKTTVDPISPDSPVLGKWTFVSFISSGKTQQITPSDNIQFNSDNKGVKVISGVSSSFQFTVVNNNVSFIDNSLNVKTYRIKILTSHDLDIFNDDEEMVLSR